MSATTLPVSTYVANSCDYSTCNYITFAGSLPFDSIQTMSCPFHQLSCKLRVSRTSYSLIAITITFYMCRLLMSLRYSVPQVPQMCDMYPDIGDVGYVVKTGATELSRLEASWSTSLKCVRDLMILSDLEQSFMDHVVHDVLDMVPQSVTESNPDFDLYRQQRRLKSQNRDHEINVALAALFAPSAHPHHREKNSAWVLDKYKFLHMIERAYQLQPGRKWYLFLEVGKAENRVQSNMTAHSFLTDRYVSFLVELSTMDRDSGP